MSFFMFVLYISPQCSSQSDPTSANQQVQLLLEEKQHLEAHNHQVCVQGPFSYSNLHVCHISACSDILKLVTL